MFHVQVPVFGGGCLIPIIWEGKEIQPTSITPSGPCFVVVCRLCASTHSNLCCVFVWDAGSQVYTVQMPVPDKGWQVCRAHSLTVSPCSRCFGVDL